MSEELKLTSEYDSYGTIPINSVNYWYAQVTPQGEWTINPKLIAAFVKAVKEEWKRQEND